jgi:hypothetical protein
MKAGSPLTRRLVVVAKFLCCWKFREEADSEEKYDERVSGLGAGLMGIV